MTTTAFKPVGKISPNSLGDPTFVRNLKPTDEGYNKTHLLGAIIGSATGMTMRNNPNDDSEPSIGLLGTFEGVPANPDEPVLRSDVLFLPRSMQAMVVKAMCGDNALPQIRPKRGQKQDIMAGLKIDIAVEIGVRRNDSSVGYEYVTVSHGKDPFTVSDPLAGLRSIIPLVASRAPALQITAPVADTSQGDVSHPIETSETEQPTQTQETPQETAPASHAETVEHAPAAPARFGRRR